MSTRTSLRRHLIAGLIVIAPVTATAFVLWWIFQLLDGLLGRFLYPGLGRLLGREEFDEEFTYITGDGAAYLAEAGVELVGLDYLSIEAFDAEEPVAHRTLLEREIIAVEGIDLRNVQPGRYELICLPLRVDIDGAPVRAVLRELTD